ncbi:hypothetical protein ACTXT7_008154 [Hymenolepis weldensis]
MYEHKRRKSSRSCRLISTEGAGKPPQFINNQIRVSLRKSTHPSGPHGSSYREHSIHDRQQSPFINVPSLFQKCANYLRFPSTSSNIAQNLKHPYEGLAAFSLDAHYTAVFTYYSKNSTLPFM